MNGHPFLIDQYDLLIVFLSALVRLLFTMKYKAKELEIKGEAFVLSKYFDFKHTFRWCGHLICAVVFVLILPEVFVTWLGPKYFPDLKDWTFAADAVVGFLGYDLVKLLEKLSYKYVSKWLKLNSDRAQ